MEKNPLSINDLKQAFFSLKRSSLLLENEIFPEKIEIAEVTTFFRNGYPENITN